MQAPSTGSAPAVQAVPASDLIPEAFSSSGVPSWMFLLRSLKPEIPQRVYICDEKFHSGYGFWDKQKVYHISKEFPENYAEIIQTKFKKEELATPSEVWMCRAWHVEGKKMVALILDSYPILQTLSKILSNPEFFVINSCSNFFLTLSKDSAPITPALTYTVRADLRPSQNPELFAATKEPWFPDNYWIRQSNPFQPLPEAPAVVGAPLPPAAAAAPTVAPAAQAPAPAPAAPATEEVW